MSASAKLLQSSASFYGRKYLEVVSALPPTDVPSQGDRSQVGGINEIAFDYNLVVILAALLCVLVGALGLKSMVRSALCCNRQVVSDSTDDVAIQLDNNGLKKKDMRVLPAIVYSAGSLFLKAGSDCPICLTEFVEGENVRVLPKCNHSFHVDCIDMWLFAHSSCPTCRHCLLDIISDTKSGAAPSCDPSSSVQPSESEGSQMVPSNPLVQSNERPSAVPDDTSPLPSSNSIASADLEAE